MDVSEDELKGLDRRKATYTHRKCKTTMAIGALLAERYIDEGIGSMSRSVCCAKCQDQFHPSAFDWVIMPAEEMNATTTNQ